MLRGVRQGRRSPVAGGQGGRVRAADGAAGPRGRGRRAGAATARARARRAGAAARPAAARLCAAGGGQVGDPTYTLTRWPQAGAPKQEVLPAHMAEQRVPARLRARMRACQSSHCGRPGWPPGRAQSGPCRAAHSWPHAAAGRRPVTVGGAQAERRAARLPGRGLRRRAAVRARAGGRAVARGGGPGLVPAGRPRSAAAGGRGGRRASRRRRARGGGACRAGRMVGAGRRRAGGGRC